MKLKPADIDRILEENIPKPQGMRSAHDFDAENAAARDQLVAGLVAQQSQSVARIGTVLPPPPKSMKTQIDGPNDFGAPITTTVGDSGVTGNTEGDAAHQVPLPMALRGGDLDKINSRADLMQLLTTNLPLNEIGLPKIIYRADLLDWRLFQGSSPLGTDPTPRYQTMQQYLDVATIYLNYAEGFPALPTGEPLWAKLPFEDADHFRAFTSYCTLVGQRYLAAIPSNEFPQEHVINWFHEDYWSIRVKCYDMLHAIHAAKVREQRILACEDSHYLKAEKMMNKLEAKFEAINWDHVQEDPKLFVDLMEKVMKLQRMALGQSTQGNDKKEVKAETLEVTMRKIATPNLVEDKTKDGGVDVRALLRNPQALSTAQELIVRMTRQTTTSTNSQSSDGE